MRPVVKLSIGLVHIAFLVENRNMVSKSKVLKVYCVYATRVYKYFMCRACAR